MSSPKDICRVLGFHKENDTNQIYSYFKGRGGKSDLADLVTAAFSAPIFEVTAALERANEIKWKEASNALKVVLDVRREISNLEVEIENLKKTRTIEIEADDWCRKNGLSKPKAPDFIKMTAELKPIFHDREAFQSWDKNMPDLFKKAYDSVISARNRIKAMRAVKEE